MPTADSRQQSADSRQQTADSMQQAAGSRQQAAGSRQQTADSRRGEPGPVSKVRMVPLAMQTSRLVMNS
jgi:hypothetical protein